MKQALNVVELGIVESDGGCPVGAARPVPDEQLVAMLWSGAGIGPPR